MFVACPHCGYLVALIVAKDGPARACPRCNGALHSETAHDAARGGDGTAHAEPAPGAQPVFENVPLEKNGGARNPAAQSASIHPATVEPEPVASAPSQIAPVAHAPLLSDGLRKPGTVAASLRGTPPAAVEPRDRAATDAAATPADAGTAEAQTGNDDTHAVEAIPPRSQFSDTPAAQAHDARDVDAAGDDASARTPPATTHDDASADEPAPADASATADTQPAENTASLPPLSAAAGAATARKPARGAHARNGKSETAVSSSRPAPSFARQQARARATTSRRPWGGIALAIALVLVLALQLLLAQRAELAADARWRPLLATLCGVAACEIPPWREPTALTMLNRNVLPVADRAGVLRVSAGFRNDARWAQPWPTLVLSLEDVDGRRVGQRAFSVGEYRKGAGPGELIAPGQSAAVQFEVREPAPNVVAFTFDFH